MTQRGAQPSAPTQASWLEPGRNCWRRERATRTCVIQDAADYFRLLRRSLLRARRSVFVIGWDITAGLDLLPGGADDGAPTQLAALLDHVARRRRGLDVFVLVWEHSALHWFERDPFTRLKLGWLTHRRVRFRYDDQHPIAASQHAKMVVIDDDVAFCGGIDLTTHRWDTSSHRVDEPQRVNTLGLAYGPYHDVQMLVEGPAARALGEFARERWRRIGRKRLPAVGDAAGQAWPDEELAADFPPVDVAIARTEPAYGGREGVREVEALFLDTIARARRCIYVEQQYFTDAGVGRALAERLREPDGPEVIVVGPGQCFGWLEHSTMGVLREHVFSLLRAADAHGRLRILHPVAQRLPRVETFVHAKVMIVDDELLRVGSANVAGRSMGVDTECDLALAAAGDSAIAQAIRTVRARLVAEHVGATPTEVLRAVMANGSLGRAIDAFGDRPRTLLPLAIEAPSPAAVDNLRALVDPTEPIAAHSLHGALPAVAEDATRGRHLVRIVPAVVAVALLALVVWWWAAPAVTRPWADVLRTAPGSAAMFGGAVAATCLAGLVFVPTSLAAFVAIVLLGPLYGVAAAAVGNVLAALGGYGAGVGLGRHRLGAWLRVRAQRRLRSLDARSVMRLAVLRFVPIASATTLHLLCGGVRVPLLRFLAGSTLGFAVPLLLLAGVGGLVRTALLERDPWWTAAAVGAAMVATTLLLRARQRFLLQHVARRIREHGAPRRFG